MVPSNSYDAKIISTETGTPVEEGTGEIVVMGPSLFTGYLNKPLDTMQAAYYRNIEFFMEVPWHL